MDYQEIELFFYEQNTNYSDFLNNSEKYSIFFTKKCGELYNKIFDSKKQYTKYNKVLVKINLPEKVAFAFFVSNKTRSNYKFILTTLKNDLWFIKLFYTYFSDRLFSKIKIPDNVTEKNLICYINHFVNMYENMPEI
jgi:hypothetical protein